MFKKNFKGIMSTVLIVCFSFFSYNKINAMKIGYSRGNFCNVADYNKDYEKIFNGYLCYFKEKLEYKTKEIKPNDKYRLKIPDEIHEMDLNIFSDFLKSVDIFDTIHITKKEYKLLFDKVKKIKKVMSEVKTEKDKLFLFYVYFYELFKIFKSNFFEIVKISNLYTEKMKYFVNNLESKLSDKDKENIKKDLYDRLGIKPEVKVKVKDLKLPIYRDDNSAFRLEYEGNYGGNGYLGICVKNMLECSTLMDETYGELLKFKNNIKNNTLFDLKFVKDRQIMKNLNIKWQINKQSKKKSKKIEPEVKFHIGGSSLKLRVGFDLTDNIKEAEELFNPKNTVEDLTKYLKEIIESSNFKKVNNYSYCKNFIDNLNKKDISSSSVLDNIKKEIELRKELMPIVKKIILKDY